MRQVIHRWSGQVLETLDGLAYIGADPAGAENVFIATGDSGMGMTHATIAALILTDLIGGWAHPWASLYDPARKPARSLLHFTGENLNVAAQYRDHLTAGELPVADDIPPGTGAIIRRGIHKIAAFRAPDGSLHQCSAVCPHLGCIVTWNSQAASWDCPCHGSRFDPFGHVLTGPAVTDLDPAAE
jgi:Rieske Fe-S protein